MNKKVSLKQIKNSCDDWSKHPLNIRAIGPMSPYVTYFLNRYIPMTPNQISFLWGFLGILAAIVMSLGGYWNLLIGILIYYVALLLDYVDGEMARAMKRTTLGGTYLDRLFHYVHRGLLFIGLGIGLYNTNGNIIYLYLGIWTCLLFTYDNLAKLKVYETLINENRTEYLTDTRSNYLKAGNQNYSHGLYQTLKSYTLEMLRPNNPFSLIFFAILFNISEYYLILMTFISTYLLIQSITNIYKKIGNIPSSKAELNNFRGEV